MAHVYFVGGGKRDRTDDLLHAMQALSQLSYTPDAVKDYTESATSLPRELAIDRELARQGIGNRTSTGSRPSRERPRLLSRIRARTASRAARAACAHPVDDQRSWRFASRCTERSAMRGGNARWRNQACPRNVAFKRLNTLEFNVLRRSRLASPACRRTSGVAPRFPQQTTAGPTRVFRCVSHEVFRSRARRPLALHLR